MCNITFEDPRLSTFVFKKCSEKILTGHTASRHLYGSQSRQGQSPDYVSMLGQRRIRLTGIEPAMGCDAGPTLHRYWVGRPTLCVPGTSYRPVHCPAMVVEGIGLHVEDIHVSFNIYILDI